MTDLTERKTFLHDGKEMLEKNSRVDNVFEIIKNAILHGHWIPGEKINDAELSKELNVSRLTVREALYKLEEIHIIERKHFKGYQVRKLSVEEIEKIIEMRNYLEQIVFEKVLKNMKSSIQELIALLEDAVTQATKAFHENDYATFRYYDFHFHEIFYNFADNFLLKENIIRVYQMFEVTRYSILEFDEREISLRSIDGHNKILSFMKAKKYKDALNLIQVQNKEFLSYFDNEQENPLSGSESGAVTG